jgi:hypothetical protein
VEWELTRTALSMAQPQLKKTTRLQFSSSRVVSVRDTLPAPDSGCKSGPPRGEGVAI